MSCPLCASPFNSEHFFYPVQRFGHRLLLITNHCLNLLFPLKGSMSEGFNFHTLLKTATKTNGYLQKRGHPITANVINFHYKIWRPLVRKKGTKRKKFTELEHVHTYIIFFGMWLFCQKLFCQKFLFLAVFDNPICQVVNNKNGGPFGAIYWKERGGNRINWKDAWSK